MKIGVMADTHINDDNNRFFHILENCFSDVDLLIHAGDYTSSSVLKMLRGYKNFCGVTGNCDGLELSGALREKEIITLEGYRIGIAHGHGPDGNTLDRVYKEFAADYVDIIIFGHSHQPVVKTKQNILLLNPGSLTSKRREKWFSYIILELFPEYMDVQVKFHAHSFC